MDGGILLQWSENMGNNMEEEWGLIKTFFQKIYFSEHSENGRKKKMIYKEIEQHLKKKQKGISLHTN